MAASGRLIRTPTTTKQQSGSGWTLGTEVINLARARTLNGTARTISETQATVGGSNALVPIVYGTQRVGGRIAAITADDHLYVAVVWCLGEVDSVVSVTINDEDLPSGVTATHYTGTAGQTTNATLAAKISGFADAMPGICYSVFDCRPGRFSGFPRFNAVVKGLKVPQAAGGGSVGWSDNPAYLLAALIENTTWGMGRAVDWATVATAASACDALVGGAEKKRLLNIVLDVSQPADAWLQSLRDYAGVFVVPEGASYRLVVDTTGSSIKSFTTSNIVAGTMRLAKRGLSDTPTMVEVTYTDTTHLPYREGRYMTAAVSPRRVSRIARPGITRYSEAKRYATERLNEAILNDLTATFEAFDEALSLQVGDLIDITHPLGPAAKVMRLARLDPISPGRWKITATEYDPAKYDGTVATGPTTPDTALGGPQDQPPAVTGLSWADQQYQDEQGNWQNRIVVTWTAPTAYPWIAGFKVTMSTKPASTWLLAAEALVEQYVTEWASPPIKPGQQHTVAVYALSTLGVVGLLATTGPFTPAGRAGTAPAAVSSLTADVATPGTAILTWPSVTSADIRGYEIRAGGANWAAATPVAFVGAPATRAEITGLAAGSTTFRIKALDAVRSVTYPTGQESASDATATATVKAVSELDTIAGNLTFSGASVRIKADFSNATVGNRAAFQTSTTNGATGVGLLPNGTGTSSTVNAYAASDPANSALLQFKIDSAVGAIINSTKAGTGTTLALGMYIDSTQYAQLDASGRWSWKFSSKAGAPTTSDIPSGYVGVWKDTSGGSLYLYANDGGTLKKVALT